MAKIELNTVSSGYFTNTLLNDNFVKIEDQLNDDVLYRDNPDGEPNQLAQDIDANGTNFFNARDAIRNGEFVTLGQVISDSDGLFDPISVITVTETLVDGQTVVSGTGGLDTSALYISGDLADNGRLVKGIDFTFDLGSGDYTLTQSYPAGTLLSVVIFGTDEDEPSTAEEVKLFDNVATLEAQTTLTLGDIVQTKGYTTSNDGGQAQYIIVGGGTGTEDGGSYLDLASGQQAELNKEVRFNAKQFGAGLGSADDAPFIQAAIDASVGSLDFNDGTYLMQTSVDLRGNLTLNCSTGAIFRPKANGFNMFQYTGPAIASNIVIYNMFASDFEGEQTDVTMIQLEDCGTGCELHSIKATQLERMINVIDNTFGLKIYSPSSFLVPKPIECSTTVGTTDVFAPNLDDSADIGGGNDGTGIKFGGSGTVYGGYIQGFENCIEFQSRGATYSTYLERAADAGVFCNGSYGVTCVGNFWFGFAGSSMYKGRNAEGVRVINPIATVNNALIGIFDFDDTNRSCSYELSLKQDGSQNQRTLNEVVVGIQNSSYQNDAFRGVTTEQSENDEGVVVDTFRVELQDNTTARVEVQVEAIETNSFFGSVSGKFILLLRQGVGAANNIVPVGGIATEVVDFALTNTNANFIQDIVVTSTQVADNLVGISVQVNSTGVITPLAYRVRSRVEAETSGTIINTWAL